jgi:Uma2 family endonuclease
VGFLGRMLLCTPRRGVILQSGISRGIVSPTTVIAAVRGYEVSVALLTAEQFAERYPNHRVELVKGHVVPVPPGSALHGETCANATRVVGEFVKEHGLGRVTIADTWVITERGPDSMRGADLCFYSYHRLPRGPFPDDLLEVRPDMVIEVLEPALGWGNLYRKLGEYLDAGVQSVILLDPRTKTASQHDAKGPGRILHPDETLTLPDVLSGFSVPVKQFFE